MLANCIYEKLENNVIGIRAHSFEILDHIGMRDAHSWCHHIPKVLLLQSLLLYSYFNKWLSFCYNGHLHTQQRVFGSLFCVHTVQFYVPLKYVHEEFFRQPAHFEVFRFSLAQNRRNLQSFPCGPHYKSSYHYRDGRRLSNTLLLLLYGTRGQTRAAVWFVQFSTAPSVPVLLCITERLLYFLFHSMK